VKTYDGTAKEVDTDAVDFEISTRAGRKKFAVRRAYTVDKLKIAPNPPVTELPIDSWPHLAGIKFPCVNQDDVTVLVGTDVVGAQFDSKIKPPPPHLDGPAAFKTPFGWCLGGKTGPPSGGEGVVFNSRISTRERWSSLDAAMQRSWTEEQDCSVCKVISTNEKCVEEILKSAIKCQNNQYTVALMRKSKNSVFRDSRDMALERLFASERPFARDPEHAKTYDAVVQEEV